MFSAALVLCAGRTEAEFERRAKAIGREPAELRENGAAGLVDEVAATVRRWAADDRHHPRSTCRCSTSTTSSTSSSSAEEIGAAARLMRPE